MQLRSWLTLAGLVLFGALAAALFLSVDYPWKWAGVENFLWMSGERTGPGLLLRGLGLTLAVSAASLVLGSVLGLLLALVRLSPEPVGRRAAGAYIELVRGTPLLVQLYLVYNFFGTALELSRFTSGVVALALFTAAYVAEILRAGVESVGPGQMEAARSLGMTRGQALRHVILPQALRRSLPPLTGQFISLIKDSSLVSVISLEDLTMQGSVAATSSFRYVEIWFVVAALYLVLTLPLSAFTRWLEAKMGVAHG